MKKSKTMSVISIFILLAIAAPAYALDIGLNTGVQVKTEDGRERHSENEKEDHTSKGNDHAFSSRVKSWLVNTGTTGQITATSATTITVKSQSGEIYTVTTTDAAVRVGKSDEKATLATGQTVYVAGIKNGNTIVASLIIVGKTKDDVTPTQEEKRQSYFGVVTAKTNTTLTITSANNVVYTVSLASDAQIWSNKEKQSSFSNFAVGENVVIQGTLSGKTITAKKVMAIHLPEGTIQGKVTASNNGSLTILGTDNTSYTVVTTDASVKANGGSIAVGDTIVVKGELTETTLDAKTVTEINVNGGFFHRIGIFFKGIFGGKNK